jgi:hypothetical protein
MPWLRSLHSGIVSACHRGDWSYESQVRIQAGYGVVALKNYYPGKSSPNIWDTSVKNGQSKKLANRRRFAQSGTDVMIF